MTLITAYAPAFTLRAPCKGELGQRQDLRLQVRLKEALDEVALEKLDAAVTAWIVLAGTGAMSGEAIPAGESGIADHGSMTMTEGAVTWLLSGVRLDDRAAIVLLNLLLDNVPGPSVESVDLLPIHAGASALPVRSSPDSWDVYPGQDASLRFSVERDEELMESGAATILFDEAPSEEQSQEIFGLLLTWAGVSAWGAYAIAPSRPSDCGLIVDDALVMVEDELVLDLGHIRCHEGAFVGLVNVVAAIDQRIARVRELIIES
ncbi:hypothetical protein G6O69_11120 [Pseudenhygromyxa sp. WMMC2535]|uniref:hypothetical protein n=1 Tax=Pseudenhygromyxa sp. WMMC2535 TaxID=2712867 RepID=UPI0015549778|nr:hypothetical protein [Pseudenhygromyxa sp. WMMC2535]NVB38382.1 hypothetical protein [Pseudenhygromyxa sp. WMMC2535]